MIRRSNVLSELAQTLAANLPDRTTATLIAQQAGLDRGWLNLDGAPVAFWTAIVDEAERAGRVEQVIDGALGRAAGAAARWAGLREQYRACAADQVAGEPAGPSRGGITRTIPAPVADFTGRAADVDALVTRLTTGPAPVICLREMGGIGKTQLALAIARRLREPYPDQLMFDLQPAAAPLSPDELLTAVIRAYWPEFQPPSARAELERFYREQLGGRRGLLVLDNADNAEQVNPLLPPPEGWAVIVTARCRFPLPGARMKDVPLLLPDEAVTLLARMLADGGRDDLASGAGGADLAPLAQRCGRLPLALRLAAGYLTCTDRSLADYLADLDRPRLDHLTDDTAGQRQVRQVLGIDRLSRTPGELRRWRDLAVFPAPFDAAAAAAVWALPKEEAQETLDRLRRESLVECEAGAYSLHELLAEIALEEPPAPDVFYRHADYYLDLGAAADALYLTGEVVEALKRFERVLPHLLGRVAWMQAQAGERALTWLDALPDRTKYVLDLRMSPAAKIDLLTIALQAARQLHDRKGEGNHLRHIGSAHASLGRPEQEVDYAGQALQIAREIGDRSGEEKALGYLGNAYKNLGQFDQAVEHYRQGLAICREIGDRLDEGRWLGNMGNAYKDVGQLEQAIEQYGQALAISREIKDRRAEGTWLGNLGNAYDDLGQFEKAIEHDERALQISHELGDRRGEGIRLSNLGNAHKELGQVEQAIAYYEQALQISREVNDRNGEASRLGNLARAYEDQGRVTQAIAFYEQALAISREVKDRKGEANRLTNLGIAYKHLGQVDKALAHYEQALQISREIKDRRGEANRLGNLGNAYEDTGKVGQAIEYYQQALAISRAIKDRQAEANHLGNLANAYQDLGQFEKAIAHQEQALQISREIKDRQGEANRLGNLGLAHRELGRLPQAIAYSEQALAIRREIGDRRGEVKDLNNLGNVAQDQGQVDQAVPQHERALAISREMKYPRGEAQSLGNLARAHLALGQVAQAAEECQQALQISRAIQDRQGEGMHLAGLGAAQRQLGQPAAAIEALEGALAIARELGRADQEEERSRALAELSSG